MKTFLANLLTYNGLALLLAGLGGGCERKTDASAPVTETPVEVKTVHPRRGEITRSITLPGEVKAYQQATLYAKVAGYLKTITVDKGDPVKEGTLLAVIEVPELLADRARYQAEVKVAEIDYQRLSESLKKSPDLVVPQTVDDAQGRYEIAKANLERTETLLNYAKITAPFSGIITKRLVDPGAFIPAATSGSSAQNAALVTLAQFDTVRVQVGVPEMEAAKIAKDQPIKVTAEALPGRTFTGSITRFAYALDETSKTMLAEIELPNPKLELRPEMYVAVTIGIEHKSDAVLLPSEAVLVEKAGASVFTVADNTLKKTPVVVGFNDGANVEIVRGMQSDQPVVLVGKQALSNGQKVKVMEAK